MFVVDLSLGKGYYSGVMADLNHNRIAEGRTWWWRSDHCCRAEYVQI